jgi:hypothetical protein
MHRFKLDEIEKAHELSRPTGCSPTSEKGF